MGETPYDRYAEVKLSGDVVAELEAVVGLLSARSLARRRGARARSAASRRASAAVTISTPARLEAALAGGERGRADRVEVAAELLEAVRDVAVGDPAGELGDRGRQRSLELKCSFRVAAVVEIAAGAQGELLTGERDVAGGEQRGEALGRAVLGAAAGARRLGLGDARAPRSRRPRRARRRCRRRRGRRARGRGRARRGRRRRRGGRRGSARGRRPRGGATAPRRGPWSRRRRSPSRASPGRSRRAARGAARRRGASASVTTTTSWTSSPA